MKVYVVKVTPEASISKISQEGYLRLEFAQAFIEGRLPTPKAIDAYHYRDEDYTDYEIVEVQI